MREYDLKGRLGQGKTVAIRNIIMAAERESKRIVPYADLMKTFFAYMPDQRIKKKLKTWNPFDTSFAQDAK